MSATNNIFPFVAYITGEKSFKDVVEIIEYPYWLKKRKFWFYPYEGSGCIPVEKLHIDDTNKGNVWIRIYTKDNTNTKINSLGQDIAKLILNLKDGKYIVDINRMKVIYDLTLMESMDCYFSVNVPNKSYDFFLTISESHGGDINEIGRRKPALIKGGNDLSLVGIAALISYSNIMINPKSPADFGHGVFKKILEEQLYVPVISSSTYLTSLPEFLIPSLRGDSLSEKSKEGIEILNEQFLKIISVENEIEEKKNSKAIIRQDYKVKLSNIIETKSLPIITTGKMIINVEVDFQPEGEKILDAYICEQWLYITVDRDPDKLDIADLRKRFDLEFIVWMPNGSSFNKSNLSTTDSESFRE